MDPDLREALEQFGTDLRADIRSGDAELHDALGRLATDPRAEIRSVDAELRDALGPLAVDLRGEIRAGDAETRAYVDTSARETRAYVDTSASETRAHVEASAAETRRYFGVIAEALRGDIRSLAELMAISNEGAGRRMDEPHSRTGGLEGRVRGLEARGSILEDDRKSRSSRPRQ